MTLDTVYNHVHNLGYMIIILFVIQSMFNISIILVVNEINRKVKK